MGVLIALTFLLLASPLEAHELDTIAIDVIYDSGDPQASVGILGEELVEAGDLFENYRILTFEPHAIIFTDTRTREPLKWIANGVPRKPIRRKALHLFVAKQMRAIYLAQSNYYDAFGEGFSPRLDTLIQQGLLADGFEEGRKQGYRFSIAETGRTGRLAPHYEREPTFLAVAEPLQGRKRFYFAVDQLGDVRFSDSRQSVSWGPVWDYADLSGGPPHTSIRVE